MYSWPLLMRMSKRKPCYQLAKLPAAWSQTSCTFEFRRSRLSVMVFCPLPPQQRTEKATDLTAKPTSRHCLHFLFSPTLWKKQLPWQCTLSYVAFGRKGPLIPPDAPFIGWPTPFFCLHPNASPRLGVSSPFFNKRVCKPLDVQVPFGSWI